MVNAFLSSPTSLPRQNRRLHHHRRLHRHPRHHHKLPTSRAGSCVNGVINNITVLHYALPLLVVPILIIDSPGILCDWRMNGHMKMGDCRVYVIIFIENKIKVCANILSKMLCSLKHPQVDIPRNKHHIHQHGEGS